MWGCPYPFPDSSRGFEGTSEEGGSAVSVWTPVTLQLGKGAGVSTDESVLVQRNVEHGAGYSWLSASPAPPVDDAPAQGSGQATVGLADTRMPFSRSEDISLLIVVDMPGWRLFVSLETAPGPSWNSTPTTVICGHGEQPCAHPLPRWVLMSQSNILGSSSTSVMQPHPGKCSLLSPWVLSRARLSKRVRAASETFQEGLSNLGAFCNTGGNDQADGG